MNIFNLLEDDNPIEYLIDIIKSSGRKITPEHIQLLQSTANGALEELMPKDLQIKARQLMFGAPAAELAEQYGHLHLINFKDNNYYSMISARYLYRYIITAYINDFYLKPGGYIVIHCLWDILPTNFNNKDLVICTPINPFED